MNYYDEASLMALQGSRWRTAEPAVSENAFFGSVTAIPIIGATIWLAAELPVVTLSVGAMLLTAIAINGFGRLTAPIRSAPS